MWKGFYHSRPQPSPEFLLLVEAAGVEILINLLKYFHLTNIAGMGSNLCIVGKYWFSSIGGIILSSQIRKNTT